MNWGVMGIDNMVQECILDNNTQENAWQKTISRSSASDTVSGSCAPLWRLPWLVALCDCALPEFQRVSHFVVPVALLRFSLSTFGQKKRLDELRNAQESGSTSQSRTQKRDWHRRSSR